MKLKLKLKLMLMLMLKWTLMQTLPALDKAICASRKTDQKVSLSERSEFRHFPVFREAQIVPTRSDGTRRAQSQRRLFFAYFTLA
ncbi:hypothetical protein [Undibacterium sp. SXout20W]|uniref:hypothetical protein n=1 Tax=Undibacterium sp. SXout20W TaxID=3413051 RepID=UPI003BF58D1D